MIKIIKYLILLWSYFFHRNHKSKIIYYHDVGKKYTDMGTDLDAIRRHLEIVKKCGYKIVDDITEREGQIMVCFDDGWAGILEAKGFFCELGVFPTIFIAVDLIGKPGYLTLEQIKEMQDIGFHFEGHAWRHRDLTTFDEKELEHEIIDSKKELSKMLGKVIEAICFPQGRFSDKVLRCCVKAGYSKLYSSITGGYFDFQDKKGVICRNLVQSVSDKEFSYTLNSTSLFFVKRSLQLHFQK